MAKRQSKTNPRLIKSKERQAQALELRKAGATYRQIAEQLGYRSPQAAHKSVTSALKKLVEEPAKELRKMELERLDGMFIVMYRQAKQGILGAVDRCLRIMERRSKMLGLDVPQKFELTWQRELIALMLSGDLTSEEVISELGEDLAGELFESAGISLSEARKAEATSESDREV